MKKQFYAIQLEDYSMSKVAVLPKTYYGTMDNIAELIDCLAADPIASIKFASTIRAFRLCQNGDLWAMHAIAGKAVRLLTPVRLIHETLILQQDVQWHFYNGAHSHRMHADLVDIHQVLLQDGDMYLRCIRPCYEGLKFENPYVGWTYMPDEHHGFPHIYETHEGWHYMRLYTMEQVERMAEPCLVQMDDACYISHHEACNDLFGA